MFAVSDTAIRMSLEANLLPSITSVISLADQAEKDSFMMAMNVKEEPSELPEGLDPHDKVVTFFIKYSFLMNVKEELKNGIIEQLVPSEEFPGNISSVLYCFEGVVIAAQCTATF